MEPCQDWEHISSLMDGWMMEVGLSHLLCIAVENPINRSLGRHRLYPLLCERLLDGSGPTVFAMLGQCLAQGHDNLGNALGRFGRGGSGASAQCCAPGEIRCQVAIPPFVEPAFRAGQFPADVLYRVACEVSVDGPLSALFVRLRHGGLLWSLLPYLTCQIALCSRCHGTINPVAAACRGAWAQSGLPSTPVQATCVGGCEAAPTALIRRRLPRWPSALPIPPLCDCAPSLSVATCIRWHMAWLTAGPNRSTSIRAPGGPSTPPSTAGVSPAGRHD